MPTRIDQASTLFEADEQVEIAVRPRVFAGARAEDTHVVGAVSAGDAKDRFGRKMGHGDTGHSSAPEANRASPRGNASPSSPIQPKTSESKASPAGVEPALAT